MIDQSVLALLPTDLPACYDKIEVSYEDSLTQGAVVADNSPGHTVEFDDTAPAAPVAPTNAPKPKHLQRPYTVSFLDMFASRIDDMFTMYPYETKRDIRTHLRTRLIDWVAQNARGFFGPSTSRAISACLRGRDITVQDLERFAEMVSFFVGAPVRVGKKLVVWHGYEGDKPGYERDCACELVLKQQGVFVVDVKK